MRIFIVVAIFLGGCTIASPESSLTVSLEAKQQDLVVAARRALLRAGITQKEQSPALRLGEEIREEISLIGKDGTAAAYNIHYELNFRWHGKDYALKLETVISHNESSYLAGTRQRAVAVASMRQSALAQMVSLLDESAI